MSEFHVEVVRVGEIKPHPNADRLGITRVRDYPVIVALGEFQASDTAVYVPVDALVPADAPRWEFLAKGQSAKTYGIPGAQLYYRIRAVKLRGTFSMGLLTRAPAGLAIEDDARAALRIEKYEPPEPVSTSGEDERDPGFLPHYDVEALRRWPGVLLPGEQVVITEKIHGCCGMWAWHNDRLWVASHTTFKAPPPEGTQGPVWWRAAVQYDMANRLREVGPYAFYGEVYGPVQDLKYGMDRGALKVAVFDVLNTETRVWLDFEEAFRVAEAAGLPWVPILYTGPWHEGLREHAEGQTTVAGATHVREGIVIRLLHERYQEDLGRVLLKLHGEGFLTRKGG